MEVFKCVQCFIGFWKDFQVDQKWRFPELPPSQFMEWLELSRPESIFSTSASNPKPPKRFVSRVPF